MRATRAAPICSASSRKCASAFTQSTASSSRTRSFYGRSKSMNTGPDVYPPEALADDEPRYLRRQRPLEIRRRKFGRKSWPAYRRWLLAGTLVLVGGALTYESLSFLLFSPRVALSDYDQIEIDGNQYVSRDAITEKFTADLGKSI